MAIRTQKSLTLIELVLGIVLLALVVTAVSLVHTTFIKNITKDIRQSVLYQRTSFAMEHITKRIQASNYLTVSGTTLNLFKTYPGTPPTTVQSRYYLDANNKDLNFVKDVTQPGTSEVLLRNVVQFKLEAVEPLDPPANTQYRAARIVLQAKDLQNRPNVPDSVLQSLAGCRVVFGNTANRVWLMRPDGSGGARFIQEYGSIQEAVDAALSSYPANGPDQVWVSQGEFLITSSPISITDKQLILIGGFKFPPSRPAYNSLQAYQGHVDTDDLYLDFANPTIINVDSQARGISFRSIQNGIIAIQNFEFRRAGSKAIEGYLHYALTSEHRISILDCRFIDTGTNVDNNAGAIWLTEIANEANNVLISGNKFITTGNAKTFNASINLGGGWFAGKISITGNEFRHDYDDTMPENFHYSTRPEIYFHDTNSSITATIGDNNKFLDYGQNTVMPSILGFGTEVYGNYTFQNNEITNCMIVNKGLRVSDLTLTSAANTIPRSLISGNPQYGRCSIEGNKIVDNRILLTTKAVLVDIGACALRLLNNTITGNTISGLVNFSGGGLNVSPVGISGNNISVNILSPANYAASINGTGITVNCRGGLTFEDNIISARTQDKYEEFISLICGGNSLFPGAQGRISFNHNQISSLTVDAAAANNRLIYMLATKVPDGGTGCSVTLGGDIDFERNIIHDTTGQIDVIAKDTDFTDNLLYNNNCPGDWIYVRGMGSLEYCTFYNNIGEIRLMELKCGTCTGSPVRRCVSDEIDFRNCIFLGSQQVLENTALEEQYRCGNWCDGMPAYYRSIRYCYAPDGGCWRLAGSNDPIDGHNVNSDYHLSDVANAMLIFVDPINGNFHIKPTSSCATASDSGGEIGAYGGSGALP